VKVNYMNTLYYFHIQTPLGLLVAAADEHLLYGVQFEDCLSHIPSIKTTATQPVRMLMQQLNEYFTGARTLFTIPLHLQGTEFQKMTWQALQNIPYGQTISYKQLAQNVGRLAAHRAVANANGANKFVIIIPCHRVISSAGTLGGYSAGIERKVWLLEHEQKNK